MPTTRVHKAVGYATVVAMLPYLALKLAWVLGSDIGTTEPGLMHSTAFMVGNLLTAAMELIAAALAITLSRQWGRRIRAWLVLVPMWAATGLLAPVMLAAPLTSVAELLSGTTDGVGDGDNATSGLHSWVYAVVYTGFFLQGAGLATAFALHVRARWSGILGARLHTDGRRSPTYEVQVLTTVAAAGLIAVVLVARLYWAAGAGRAIGQRMLDGSSATLALVGLLGLIALVFRSPRTVRARLPLAAAWVGTGAMVWSGAYQLLILLAPGTPFESADGGGFALVLVAQMLGGVLAATTGAFLVADVSRQGTARGVSVPSGFDAGASARARVG